MRQLKFNPNKLYQRQGHEFELQEPRVQGRIVGVNKDALKIKGRVTQMMVIEYCKSFTPFSIFIVEM